MFCVRLYVSMLFYVSLSVSCVFHVIGVSVVCVDVRVCLSCIRVYVLSACVLLLRRCPVRVVGLCLVFASVSVCVMLCVHTVCRCVVPVLCS